MLPDLVLSTYTVLGKFNPPRDRQRAWNLCYDLGGDNINDPSNGLQTKVWRGRVTDDGGVLLDVPDDVPAVEVLSVPGINSFDFTFDQSMRPFIAFETNSGGYFYWYDTLIANFTTTALPADSISLRCVLDDKRITQSSNSDIVLAYVRGETLYVRLQRERYLIEHSMYTGVAGRLYQMGPTSVHRLRFQMTTMPQRITRQRGMVK